MGLAAHASSDPLIGVLPPGDAGVGISWRYEYPLYKGSDRRTDFLPIAVYDSRYWYLHSYRGGIKIEQGPWRTELFVTRRPEGFASDDVPTSMVGMARREFGTDIGVGLSLKLGKGTAYTEYLHDSGSTSDGSEIILGYRYEGWWEGRFRVRPYGRFSWRDDNLNNYYYGVRPEEATPERPAYHAAGGVNFEFGLQTVYRLTEQIQALASIGVARASSAIRGSPIVDDKLAPIAQIGVVWSFAPKPLALGERRPIIARFFYGASSDCDLFPIMTLQCTSIHTQDQTSVWAVELGQQLIENLNGWPVDMAAFVGLLRHEERGFQPDFWQVQAYLKAYFTGFPWRNTLKTRIGFGAGISYAAHPPFTEVRDQELRGRDTSKLLSYGDPTIDVSVGDLFGVRELRKTYFGLGVSHRSGIFGSSKLFGNVNGGSNYIYTFIETVF